MAMDYAWHWSHFLLYSPSVFISYEAMKLPNSKEVEEYETIVGGKGTDQIDNLAKEENNEVHQMNKDAKGISSVEICQESQNIQQYVSLSLKETIFTKNIYFNLFLVTLCFHIL